MNMKKLVVITLAATAMAFTAQAEEPSQNDIGSFGVGYQGIYVGDLISGLSMRYAPAPVGGQIEIGEGGIDIDGEEITMLMLKGKAYYSLIQRENSVFYLGASLGYYKVDLDLADAELDGWSFAPLMGAEYRFQGLAELGLNFEVSYEFNSWEIDAADADIDLRGIAVSTGINYYF